MLPSSLHGDERGQTVVLVALLFTVLLGFAALSVDAGRFYVERRFLQNAVDAAALACANKLRAGGTVAQAEAAARDLLTTYNLRGDPTGSTVTVAAPPVYSGWFNGDTTGADKRNLSDGIVATTSDCRVALHTSVRTIFIAIVNPGLQTLDVPANAHAKTKGGLQPIVVNRYDNPPGPSPPSETSGFHDYSKREDTDWNCTQDDPSGCTDAADEAVTCTSGCRWGRERVIVGQGYSSSDSDFRGFIALDVRDYSQIPIQHQFYNGVTGGMNENTLKDKEATYARDGYPGPDLPIYQPGQSQPGLQVGTLSGNSTGKIVSELTRYFKVGDYILAQLFDGQVREVPDFSIGTLSSVPASSPSGPANGPTFKVGANVQFRNAGNTVDLQAVRDSFDNGAGNWTPNELEISETAPLRFWFSPDSFTPAPGSGTTVTIKDLQVDSGLASGIYSVIIRGTSPQTGTSHQIWVPLNIGGVTRDFSMDFSATSAVVDTPGQTATFTFQLSTASGTSSWNSTNAVSFTVDRDTCDTGLARLSGPTQECKAVTISPASAVPAKTSPPTVAVSVPTSGFATGTYKLALRGSGTNGAGQVVRHVQELSVSVGGNTSQSGKYVNVQGFAVFRVTRIESNTIYGRAVSPGVNDPDDWRLSLGKSVRLIPWDSAPY